MQSADVNSKASASYELLFELAQKGSTSEFVAHAESLGESGDGHAYAVLGTAFDYGWANVLVDKTKAAAYYKRAIDVCGSKVAIRGLAKLNFLGQGVPQDYKYAFDLYSRLLVEPANMMAILATGTMLANGLGVSVDSERAKMLLRRAADYGYIEARQVLARIFWRERSWGHVLGECLGLIRSKTNSLVKRRKIISDWRY